MKQLFLRLDTGADKGRIFKVTSMGMRLGRSSSNDIHVLDEELSRNHCLFEESTSGELRVTDLASANGTLVNDVSIGADTKLLKEGDVIHVGNTYITVVDSDKPKPIEMKVPNAEIKVKDKGNQQIDLGLSPNTKENVEPDRKIAEKERPMWLNLVWFGVVALMVGSAITILLMPRENKTATVSTLAATQKAEIPVVLKELSYEKIDADSSRIFRYQISVNEDAKISLQLDDVPAANRHVRKSMKLSDKAMARLINILEAKEIKTLEKEYAGENAMTANELKSCKISMNLNGMIKEILVENSPEPEAFRELREKLETFVNNELGIWSIQYPKEKLLEMSFASSELGDSKWDERDVEFGNIAAAIKAYNESIFYLDTISPKPEWFNHVRERLRETKDELNRRYKEQLFKADRAINTGHWDDAATELRLLMEMIPDTEDERYQTAERKLLDVTKRRKGRL